MLPVLEPGPVGRPPPWPHWGSIDTRCSDRLWRRELSPENVILLCLANLSHVGNCYMIAFLWWMINGAIIHFPNAHTQKKSILKYKNSSVSIAEMGYASFKKVLSASQTHTDVTNCSSYTYLFVCHFPAAVLLFLRSSFSLFVSACLLWPNQMPIKALRFLPVLHICYNPLNTIVAWKKLICLFTFVLSGNTQYFPEEVLLAFHFP